jgi:hypothetical protein
MQENRSRMWAARKKLSCDHNNLCPLEGKELLLRFGYEALIFQLSWGQGDLRRERRFSDSSLGHARRDGRRGPRSSL